MKWQDPIYPWIPTAQDIASLKQDLADMLISDARLMIYHHGLTIDKTN